MVDKKIIISPQILGSLQREFPGCGIILIVCNPCNGEGKCDGSHIELVVGNVTDEVVLKAYLKEAIRDIGDEGKMHPPEHVPFSVPS